jgi:hypothetical protein
MIGAIRPTRRRWGQAYAWGGWPNPGSLQDGVPVDRSPLGSSIAIPEPSIAQGGDSALPGGFNSGTLLRKLMPLTGRGSSGHGAASHPF